jgi:hypothetical protein
MSNSAADAPEPDPVAEAPKLLRQWADICAAWDLFKGLAQPMRDLADQLERAASAP